MSEYDIHNLTPLDDDTRFHSNEDLIQALDRQLEEKKDEEEALEEINKDFSKLLTDDIFLTQKVAEEEEEKEEEEEEEDTSFGRMLQQQDLDEEDEDEEEEESDSDRAFRDDMDAIAFCVDFCNKYHLTPQPLQRGIIA